MRVILFTGKGGSGKTTCAAATAIRSAQNGKLTLIMSTDPAHSLSDSFDQDIGPEPSMIADNLYAQEIDMYYSMSKYWQHLRSLMSMTLKLQGLNTITAEEMSALPGMEEASAFLWLEQHIAEGKYEAIILDSAPTGETLSFLAFPQATQWWTAKFSTVPKFALKTFGAMVSSTTRTPLDKGISELESIMKKIDTMRQFFSDGENATIRIVTNPEKMVIQEAKRAYTYFQLYGYHVDAIIINRVLPPVPPTDFLSETVSKQAAYLNEIHNDFYPLPILSVPHAGKEVFGIKLLKDLSASIYDNIDGLDVLYKGTPLEIVQIDNGFRVILVLPFTREPDINIVHRGDSMAITVGNRRRHIYLPRFFSFYNMSGYQVVDDKLKVDFLQKNYNKT